MYYLRMEYKIITIPNLSFFARNVRLDIAKIFSILASLFNNWKLCVDDFNFEIPLLKSVILGQNGICI